MEINKIIALISLSLATLALGFIAGIPIMKYYYKQMLDSETEHKQQQSEMANKIFKLKLRLKKKKK